METDNERLNAIEDGGPAFPFEYGDERTGRDWVPGMTLRDYFAAHGPSDEDLSVSLQEAADIVGVKVDDYKARQHYAYVRAVLLYRFADAMLAAREKP